MWLKSGAVSVIIDARTRTEQIDYCVVRTLCIGRGERPFGRTYADGGEELMPRFTTAAIEDVTPKRKSKQPSQRSQTQEQYQQALRDAILTRNEALIATGCC